MARTPGAHHFRAMRRGSRRWKVKIRPTRASVIQAMVHRVTASMRSPPIRSVEALAEWTSLLSFAITLRMYQRMAPEHSNRPQVVVLGAGFGGLYAVRALRRAPVDVTVVDRRN